MADGTDLSSLSDAQLQALYAQQTAAPAPLTAATPAPYVETPLTPQAAAALSSQPNGPQPYGLTPDQAAAWETSTTQKYPAPSSYIRLQDGQAYLRQPAPAPSAATADTSIAPDLSTLSDDELQRQYAQATGAPVDDSPQGQALASAREGSADIPGPVRSAIQGLTFNLGDELAGAGAWAGTALGNFVNQFTGHKSDITPGDAFDATVQSERDAQNAYAEAHPLANIGFQVGGSLLNPINLLGGEFIGGARSLTAAMLRSGAVGAGVGAAYGAGDGTDFGSRFGGATSGAVYGGAGGAAIPVAGAVIGKVASPLTALIRQPPTGGVETARTMLAQLGIPIDTLPADAQSGIASAVAAGQDPGDAAIHHLASSLPVPVPLSTGQLTGDPSQQLAENLAFRGARGPTAQQIAQGFKVQQQSALRANVDQIGADLGGGFPTPRGQAGETVSDALNSRYDAMKSGVDRAYDTARGAPNPAYLGPADALAFLKSASQGMNDFDPLNVPRVSREMDRLRSAIAPWAADLPPGVNPARVASVDRASPADIRTLFDARARISHLRESNGVEAAAANAVLHHFDGAMRSALTDDLFKGDPDTVALWRSAIGQRAEMGKLFEANDLVQKLTERQGIGHTTQLRVDPHDASNYIFGRSNLGFVGRQNLYRGLARLKGALGEDSDGWNRIRGEVFSRIAAAGEGPMEGGAAQFSGAKFSTAWSKAKAEDPNLLSTLYTPSEMGVIDRFAAVANRATKPVTGGDNSSNTAATMKRLGAAMKRLPFLAIESIPFVDHFADKIDHGISAKAITDATVRARPRMVAAPNSAVVAKALTPAAIATGAVAYRRRSPNR